MNKIIIVVLIIITITIFVINFSSDTPKEGKNTVFHVTLANPELYLDGVYTNTFHIDKGEYSFRFVPNGSSPKNLSITLNGENFDLSENFKLENTKHQTGISEYFTWNYQGNNTFSILKNQEILIIINPNENTMGSVSVSIVEN